MKQLRLFLALSLSIVIFINPVYSFSLSKKEKIISYQGYIRPCIAINSKYIIINTNKEKKDAWNVGNKYVTCINYINGTLVWKKDYLRQGEEVTDLQCTDKYLLLRTDSYVSDTNYVGRDTKIICYDIETGKENWQKKYETRSYDINEYLGRVPSFILLYDNKITYYFEKKVYFVDITTGEEKQFEFEKKNICTPIVNYNHNIILFTFDGIYSINDLQINWKIVQDTFSFSFYYEDFESLGFGWNNFGFSFNRDQRPYSESKYLLLYGYNDYKNKKLAEFGFAKIDMEKGIIEEFYKADKNEFSGKPFLVSDKVIIPVPDDPKPIKCFDRKLNLLWETSNENKYYNIGLYNNILFSLSIGKDSKESRTINAFNLNDGKIAWNFDSSFKNIENAVMYDSNLFLFGDGKLQIIDLSQIDFSTKLKFNPSQGIYTQNGTSYELDTPIEINQNRVFISANNIFEPLCGKNEFENKEGSLKATLDDKTIELQIDNPIAKINGTEKQIDFHNSKIRPYINKEGYIMVPMRFIAESFGCKIVFNPETKEIIVTYQP